MEPVKYTTVRPSLDTYQSGGTRNWDFYYPSPYISHPYQIRAPEEVIYPKEVDNKTDQVNMTEGKSSWWTWGPLVVEDQKMHDYHIVDWANHQLKADHKKPFFLAVGTWKPHDPWEVLKSTSIYIHYKTSFSRLIKTMTKDAFDHGRRWIQEWVVKNKQWKKVVQSYAAAITFSDAMIGRLLDQLKESKFADNTIIVIVVGSWDAYGRKGKH